MKCRGKSWKWADVIIFTLVLLFHFHALAETRYVTDFLVITMRTGQGDEYAAVRTLKSDTIVDVIEENQDYLKIKTQEGDVGWVKKRYLTTKTPNTLIIAKLEKEVERLQLELDKIKIEGGGRLEKQINAQSEQGLSLKDCEAVALDNNQKIVDLQNELEQSKKQYQSLLSHSGNTVDLIKKTEVADTMADLLQQENKQLSSRVKILQDENAQLKLFGMIRWFVVGAAVLLIGVIIGKMSRKKRYF